MIKNIEYSFVSDYVIDDNELKVILTTEQLLCLIKFEGNHDDKKEIELVKKGVKRLIDALTEIYSEMEEA